MKVTPQGAREALPRIFGPDSKGDTLEVAGGTVVNFGAVAPRRSGNAEWLDCAGMSILPGRVSAHDHVHRSLLPLAMSRMSTPDRQFLNEMEQTVWRFERCFDSWSLEAAARLAVGRALLSGTTTMIDQYASPVFVEGSLDVVADACEELGMRAIVSFATSEREDGRSQAERGLNECHRFVASNTRTLVRGAVGLESCQAVSDDTLRKVAELCRTLGTVLHVQVGESPVDIEDARKRGFAGPVSRLDAHGALVPGSILGHGTFLQPDEVELARARGCWIAQTPRSVAELGFEDSAMAIDSDRVALGCDGEPADLSDETAALVIQARHRGDDSCAASRRCAAGRELASELFGLDFALGTGGVADAICMGTDGVSHVMVGGRLVVRDGELQTANFDALEDAAEDMAARLRRKLI